MIEHKKRANLKKISILLIITLLFVVMSVAIVSAVRVPTVGGDSDTWGTVLNTYLNVSHNGSGEIRSNVISNIQLIDGTITKFIYFKISNILSVYFIHIICSLLKLFSLIKFFNFFI